MVLKNYVEPAVVRALVVKNDNAVVVVVDVGNLHDGPDHQAVNFLASVHQVWFISSLLKVDQWKLLLIFHSFSAFLADHSIVCSMRGVLCGAAQCSVSTSFLNSHGLLLCPLPRFL